MELSVIDIVRDEGTVIVLTGITMDGTDRFVDFACDQRPARDLLMILASGEDVEVNIEDWQIIRIYNQRGNNELPKQN